MTEPKKAKPKAKTAKAVTTGELGIADEKGNRAPLEPAKRPERGQGAWGADRPELPARPKHTPERTQKRGFGQWKAKGAKYTPPAKTVRGTKTPLVRVNDAWVVKEPDNG